MSLHFVSQPDIQLLNKTHRGKDSVTDILSLPLQEISRPGVIVPPPMLENFEDVDEDELMDYYCLGSLYICLPYVSRWALSRSYSKSDKHQEEDGYLEMESIVRDHLNKHGKSLRYGNSLFGYLQSREKFMATMEKELSIEKSDMARVDRNRWVETFCSRIPVLLTHGILHLLGYDHGTEKEYEEMRRKEREVLKKFIEWKTSGHL